MPQFSNSQIGFDIDTRNVSGAVSIDLDSFDVFNLTLTGNITSFTSTGGKAGRIYRVYLIQDATGNRTIASVDAKFKIRQSRTLLLSTTAGDTDLLELDYISSTNIIMYVDYAN